MTEIIVIAAVAKNGVIGNNGDIPWRIKEDFLHFKNKTMGHSCIMGRATYESLPPSSRPLPGRENLILTSNEKYDPGNDEVKIFKSFEDAIEYCRKNNKEKVFICGGKSVYAMGLEIADTFELTKIKMDPKGDTLFPEIDFNDWELIDEEDFEKYTFCTYKRKR